MIVYEVNLDVDGAVLAEYRRWLDAHMCEILGLPGFLGVQLFERSDPPPEASRHNLCVQYRIAGEADLERYLRDEAPRMRADGLARFPGKFSATRRVLRPID